MISSPSSFLIMYGYDLRSIRLTKLVCFPLTRGIVQMNLPNPLCVGMNFSKATPKIAARIRTVCYSITMLMVLM